MAMGPFAEAERAETLWQHDRKGLVDAQGPPPHDQVAAYYEYGRYGEVQLWALKDGTAVTCYMPTLRYLKWSRRGPAFKYAKRMAGRANILNRMLGG